MTDRGRSASPLLPEVRSTSGTVDVLVVGRYFCDIVFTGLPRLPEPGEELWARQCSIVPGGAYVTALALHRLGITSAWSCTFGTDPFSNFVLRTANLEGLSNDAFEHVAIPLSNISASLSTGSERSFVSFADSAPTATSAVKVARLIHGFRPRIVLLPGFPAAGIEEMAAAARSVSALLFVDPQSTLASIEEPHIREQLTLIDIFAPNEREARLMTGCDDLAEAIPALASQIGLIVVKCGSGGALVANSSGILHVEAMPVNSVETTGAGDCFNAGFVMALLAGESVEECMRAGNAAGALSTTAPGSAGAPTRAMLDQSRRQYK